MTTTTNSKLFTYNELASRFNVTTSTIRRWFIHYQKFKPTPGTVRVPEDEVSKFINSNIQKKTNQ